MHKWGKKIQWKQKKNKNDNEYKKKIKQKQNIRMITLITVKTAGCYFLIRNILQTYAFHYQS